MESDSFVWRLLLLASLFVFPQLLGVLLSLRLSRVSWWIGRLLAVVVPGLSFFFLAPYFFFPALREATHEKIASCGMPGLAAAFMILAGTGVHFFVALVIQLYLSKRRQAFA